jgi:hypothetical protein
MRFRFILSFFLLVLLSAGAAFGQETDKASSGEAKGSGDLRAAVQNPVGAMYSLPFKFNFDYGAPNGEASFLNIQPVIPITVGDWNLINRIIIPLIDTPGQVTGTPEIPNPPPGDGASGLGDINYSLFFSPAKPKKAIWGIGPSLMMPTASDDQLGSEKWSAGPTGVVLFQPNWGTIGGLVRQLWSFEGEDNRSDVNQTLIEPFVNYNLEKGWYLITDMVITANWYADSENRWTVPLGGGVGKLLKIGSQAINVRTEAYYNVVKPDSAPDWQWGFTVQFLFPK